MNEFGNDLMPNVLTEAAISEIYMERQPDPYPSHCITSWDSTNYTNYLGDEGGPPLDTPYTLQQCQRVCR